MAVEVKRPYLALSREVPGFPFPKIIQFPDNSSTLLIGRETSCDVTLSYLWISRKHCKLSLNEGGKCTLTCLTGNGIFVNSKLMSNGESKELVELSEIRFVSPPPARISYFFHPSLAGHHHGGSWKELDFPHVQASTARTQENPTDAAKNECEEASCKSEDSSSISECSINPSPPPVADGIKSEKASEAKEDLKERMQNRLLLLEKYVEQLEKRNEQLRTAGANKVQAVQAQLDTIQGENVQKTKKMFDQIHQLVREHLSCASCNDVLVECQILGCGHCLCKKCLARQRILLPYCSKCDQRINSSFHHVAVNNYLPMLYQDLPQSMQEARKAQLKQYAEQPVINPVPMETNDSVIFLGYEEHSSSTNEAVGRGFVEESQGVQIIYESLRDDEDEIEI